MNKKFIILSVIIIIAIIAFFVSSKSPAPNKIPTPIINQGGVTMGQTSTSTLELNSGINAVESFATQEFTITAGNFKFTPSNIRVKKGTAINITLNNTEGFHDLKIDEFEVATNKLSAGESDVITFVANKTGSFEYYCSIGNHRQLGMKGMIVVE